MNERGIRLPFKLLGVPVLLDHSFLLILPLFAYLIGSQLSAYAQILAAVGVHIDAGGLQQGSLRWVLGAIGAVGLFVSVLVHELAHAVAARLYGVRTLEIRLWFLGGVARLDTMPRGRGAEAVVAIVGPITSFLIGVLLWLTLPYVTQFPGTAVVISYLAITNVALALFNMLPALPLDGGRILRGVLELFMPHLRATRVAAFISAVVAILLGLYGFFSMNLLLVVLAFFIYNAGRAEAQAAVITDAVEGKLVADVMTTDPMTVDPGMPLEQFVRMANYRPYPGYPVVGTDGQLLGYARLAAAQEFLAGTEGGDEGGTGAHATFSGATVADILQEAERIEPGETAMAALSRIAEGQLGRLMVTDASGRLIGIIGKSDLIRLLRGSAGAEPEYGGRSD